METKVENNGGQDSGTPAGSPEGGSVGSEVLAKRSGSSLSPAQFLALENLMSGQTLGEAAKGAGIGRKTLYRWMHEDADFQAEYNAWQKDTAAAARSGILALTEPAIRAVAGALEKGDSKTAMALLKSLGLLTPPVAGSTDAETVRKEQQIERKREGTRLFIEELAAGFPE
jgi:hypothetical protein